MSARTKLILGTAAIVGVVGYATRPIWETARAVARSAHALGTGVANFAHRRPHHTTALLATAILGYYALQDSRVTEYVTTAAGDAAQALVEYRSREEPEVRTQAVTHAPAQSTAPAIEMRSEEGYAFYFVKPGDTLSGISQLVSGTQGHYRTIMEDNGIEDPTRLAAGQLLRLRTQFCTKYSDQVYRRVPDLESVILANERVSARFPERWQDVLALNRELGLTYEDAYKGTRIVYDRP